MTHPTIPERVPAGVAPEGDGIVIGAGPVRVDAFIDFLCPFCRRFELSSTAAGVSATPTVLVQGVVVRPDPQAITAAVAQAGNGP